MKPPAVLIDHSCGMAGRPLSGSGNATPTLPRAGTCPAMREPPGIYMEPVRKRRPAPYVSCRLTTTDRQRARRLPVWEPCRLCVGTGGRSSPLGPYPVTALPAPTLYGPWRITTRWLVSDASATLSAGPFLAWRRVVRPVFRWFSYMPFELHCTSKMFC